MVRMRPAIACVYACVSGAVGIENVFVADLVSIVGEPTRKPDPLDTSSVNIIEASDFVSVTWSEPFLCDVRYVVNCLTRNSVTRNVYMSKKIMLKMSTCTKFDLYVCLRTEGPGA